MKTLKITKDYSKSETPLKDLERDYNLDVVVPYLDARVVAKITWRDLIDSKCFTPNVPINNGSNVVDVFTKKFKSLCCARRSDFNPKDRYFCYWSGIDYATSTEYEPALYIVRFDAYLKDGHFTYLNAEDGRILGEPVLLEFSNQGDYKYTGDLYDVNALDYELTEKEMFDLVRFLFAKKRKLQDADPFYVFSGHRLDSLGLYIMFAD